MKSNEGKIGFSIRWHSNNSKEIFFHAKYKYL